MDHLPVPTDEVPPALSDWPGADAAVGNWSLVYDQYDPGLQSLREALTTLGNGVFCTRGALPSEVAGDTHYPGTYLACGYNRLVTNVSGRNVVNEDLVNMPNPIGLTFRIEDGPWFRIDEVEVRNYRQELNTRDGILTVDLEIKDAAGRETRVRFRRFVSMNQRHFGAVQLSVTPLNWAGRMTFRASLDGQVTNYGVKRYRELASQHLNAIAAEETIGAESGERIISLTSETNQSRIRSSLASRLVCFRDGERLSADTIAEFEPGLATQTVTVEAATGRPVVAEKIFAFYTSRDPAISEPTLNAVEAVDGAGDFTTLFEQHQRAWYSLWQRFDVVVTGDAEVQKILRVHTFHLLQTLSPNSQDFDVAVPARGWSGEAYRGHIFWDELYILPALDVAMPRLTEVHLRYRILRLDPARRAAAKAGFKGAMFPWQSGSDGSEETQQVHLNPRSGRWVPDNSYLQRHVNLAIAYSVWQHYQATRRRHLLETGGAEMLLEIARFFASIAEKSAETGRYHIRKVMGPDEFHEGYPDREESGLDDNAYTNVMVAWLMDVASQIFDIVDPALASELKGVLGIDDAEIAVWTEMAHRMYVPFHDDGIISQFEGYGDLLEFDWEGYRAKYGDIHRLDRILEAEGDSANRYKLSKQADVLMLFYLFGRRGVGDLMGRLGYRFTDEMWDRNLEYYEARCSHGSTLSFVVHAWVRARTDPEAAWDHFWKALNSDVGDIQGGTTPEGIHMGAMAGTVDIVQRCFTGLEVRDYTLGFDPRIPERIGTIRLRLYLREAWLQVTASNQMVSIYVEPGRAPAIPVAVRGELRELRPGDRHDFMIG